MHKHKHQNKIIIGVLILAAIVVAVIFILARHTPTYSTTTVSSRDIKAAVRASGTVVPEDSSSLSFSSQGKIQEVNVHAGDIVHKGDILASLDTRTIKAQLDGALADEAAAEAQLNKLENGARPEEVALYSQKLNDSSSGLMVAMNNALQQANDALTNKADLLFMNGNSVNPTIQIRTQSQTEQTNINQERLVMTDKINTLKNILTGLSVNTNLSISTTSLENARFITQSTLLATQTYLSDLSTIVNNLSTGNSGLIQSVINSDLAIITGAQQEITSASNSFTTANAAYGSARDSLSLENAGTRTEDISSQSAVLAKAQAGVEAYQSALSQSYIVAPFDGTITDVNLKVGEVVVPGISANENIDIISTGAFKIEVYVPENAIGMMNVGNPADVTFDAYGSGTIFGAHVFLINPAQTVQNGVSSYKTTLHFDKPDDRIRSGLTVNTIITTATSSNALAVLTRSIVTKNNQKFVLLKDSSGNFTEKPITTGITGSDGYTQVISGLNEGDTIANFGSENY